MSYDVVEVLDHVRAAEELTRRAADGWRLVAVSRSSSGSCWLFLQKTLASAVSQRLQAIHKAEATEP